MRCLCSALLILMTAATVAGAEEPRLEEMRDKTILVFTPHPDGDLFGAGGTIALLNRISRDQTWSRRFARLYAIRFPLRDIFLLTLGTALIVAAANEAGCDTLFSEDMQHGRSIGALAIVNPFPGSTP